jgi:hypothetical protein
MLNQEGFIAEYPYKKVIKTALVFCEQLLKIIFG